MKILRILLIFLYFAFCFLLKDNFEAHFANSSYSYYSAKSVQSVDYHDNSALAQNNNQEITNIQNNNQNNNLLKNFKKNDLLKINYAFKKISKHFSYRNFSAFNFEHIIYTRAP
ncbi:MAG: hypothetical protein IJ877_00180 [Candidatus Gastranaerophilales bacterium]|nr:hypothetical protein [Candidatus Gastranaerophilales bacterium]